MKAYRLSPDEIYHLKKIEKFGGHYSFQRWPEIYWGKPPKNTHHQTEQLDELQPINIMDIDYLGMYVYESNSEGHIELFKERIEDCADRIAIDLELDFDTTYTDLCYIVLMHEMGHWLTHWCHKEEYANRRIKYIEQPTEVRETLAQLTVIWSFAELSNPKVHRRKKILLYLAEFQSYPYQQFLKFEHFFTKRGTILRRFNDLLDEKEWGLEYLLDGKKHISDERRARKTIHDFLRRSSL